MMFPGAHVSILAVDHSIRDERAGNYDATKRFKSLGFNCSVCKHAVISVVVNCKAKKNKQVNKFAICELYKEINV